MLAAPAPRPVRALPQGKDLDAALLPYRVMVSPLVTGASKALQAVPLSPLDNKEQAAHELAWSALMYQHGHEIDAKIWVAMACAGTAIARLPEIIQLIKDARNPQPATAPAPKPEEKKP